LISRDFCCNGGPEGRPFGHGALRNACGGSAGQQVAVSDHPGDGHHQGEHAEEATAEEAEGFVEDLDGA
jgi:hypothetical protein